MTFDIWYEENKDELINNYEKLATEQNGELDESYTEYVDTIYYIFGSDE